jgi:GT2 family glycosyltransferase
MLAFIDDDCLAPPHWLSEMEAALAQAPQVAAVCAAINAPDHDPSEVFMPHWSPLRIRIQRSRWPVSALCGAANMIFWADVYRDLGGFDEMTTVGAPLKAGEDQDILYRLLRRGYAVRYVPSPAVLHCGRHPVGDDLRHLMRSYALGAGAVAMKHVRLRDPGIILHLFYWWFGQLRWGRLIRLRRGNGAINFLTFARGMALSFRYPLDRRNRVYVSPRESSPEYQRNHPGLRDPSTM